MTTDILGYGGKRVVVMGCFSGTGEACARKLVELGAEVHGADIKPSPVDLASFTEVNLLDPASIEAGVASIGGEIDALFNVSGLPQTFPGEDVVTVNFVGMRHWTEQWLPKIRAGAAIATVSSLAGMAYLTRQNIVSEFMALTDFIAPLVPIGLGAGRIGNFINHELPGRITSLPWGMPFPGMGPEPRHPSALYEALLEGAVLFAILWWVSAKPRSRGFISGLFLLGYGVFRFLVEFVRMPDAHIGFIAFGWVTMGMLLTLPMIALGVVFMAWSRHQPVDAKW